VAAAARSAGVELCCDLVFGTLHVKVAGCQDRFSSTILLGGPGMQGTNEEVSPDTSRC